jgi:hypothetical protein
MDYMITEEAPGYWHYHISYTDSFIQPLCGKKITTMWTHIPLDTWGLVTHLRERYCEKCKEIYDKQNENKNEGELTK